MQNTWYLEYEETILKRFADSCPKQVCALISVYSAFEQLLLSI